MRLYKVTIRHQANWATYEVEAESQATARKRVETHMDTRYFCDPSFDIEEICRPSTSIRLVHQHIYNGFN
jgi:hypothetical protein